MVLSVTSPEGTITQTTRGAVERRGEPGQVGDVGHLGPRVVTDDFVSALAQAFPHVEAHFAETDQPELHVRLFRGDRAGQPGRRTGINRYT